MTHPKPVKPGRGQPPRDTTPSTHHQDHPPPSHAHKESGRDCPGPPGMGFWLLAIGYWLLAIGYWLLASGVP